jgi:hypothetical protein
LKRFDGFFRYYKTLFRELFTQVWSAWRSEVWPAVVVALLVFALSYRRDPNAKAALVYTVKACALYVGAWAVYHLVRTPWRLSLREPERPEVRSPKQEVLSVSSSVLDFIYERSKSQPTTQNSVSSDSLLRMMETHARHAKVKGYHQETLEIYKYKFSRSVLSAVQILEKAGLRDEAMATVWKTPADVNDVKRVGQRLGDMADQMV